MIAPEIIRFENEVGLAEAAAKEWLKIIPQESKSPVPWLVALSGGRIVKRFFESLVDLCARKSPSLDALEFFWGDERCVPPDDAESNYAIARNYLLNPLKIMDQNIHRIRGEDSPDVAARAAAADLRHLAPVSTKGQPIFDLIFLGMGEDGHVASLFPAESEAETANPSIYRPVVAAKPPPNRITLGYQVIATARQVWVLASGPGKSDALRASLKSGGRTPLAKVISMREVTRIFTDIPG